MRLESHAGRGPCHPARQFLQTMALALVLAASPVGQFVRGQTPADPPVHSPDTATEVANQAAGVEFFESRIRPLLVANCYECHNSTDSAEGGLAVDWREGIAEGGQLGSLLEDYEGKNLLLSVVRHEISGLEMPEGGAKLSEREIADLKKWLELGAPDPRDAPPGEDELREATDWSAQLERRKQWWSFQPIRSPTPPRVENANWPSDPIDHFTLSRIEQAGVTPAALAEPAALIRRLHYALIGLPPTAEEVENFTAACTSPATRDAAYERLVDRLLKSEHFGERWARHWMDWVRYADSHGSEGDPEIVGAYHYRDYLIRALNQDIPYSDLLREHIAGDLIDTPRLNSELGINESVIGTAHWRFVFHGFAPTDALDERVRFTDDAINVISKAFMGMTVSCARCHYHKFDAISQDDYYAMFGVVSSARPGRTAIDTADRLLASAEEMDQIKHEIRSGMVKAWRKIDAAALANRLAASASGKNPGAIATYFKALDSATNKSPANDEPERVADAQNSDAQTQHLNSTQILDKWYGYGAGLANDADQAALPVMAMKPTKAGSFTMADSPSRLIGSINPSGHYSNLRSSKLPARLTSTNFTISSGDSLYLLVRGGGDASLRYVVQDYPRNGTVFPVRKLANAKNARWHWQHFDLDYWKGDVAHVELAHAADGPLLAQQGGRSHFAIRKALIVPEGSDPPELPAEELEHLKSQVGFRQAATPDAFTQVLLSAIQDATANWTDDTLSDAQAVFLDACLRENLLPNAIAELPAQAGLVARYRQLDSEIPEARRIPTLAEHQGQDHPLFDRGDHRRPLHQVPRRFLEAIDNAPYNTTTSGRRELAEDMLRRDNPLTPRVIANRLWHHLFGRGIVATPDNLGRLGERPTHPELLDYLASQLRDEHDWRLKPLIRRIIMSSTWRQSTHPADANVLEADPNNLLWARASTRRLDAEAIRDSVLQVSGELEYDLFGAPVSGNSLRRSVYVRAKRNAMDSFLTTFNSPVPFSTKGRRDATNVPAQSLLLMNSRFVARRAQELIKGQDTSRPMEQTASSLWRAILKRPPSVSELESAAQFISAQTGDYQAAAAQLAALDRDIQERQLLLDKLHQQATQTWRASAEQAEDAAQITARMPAPVWSFSAGDEQPIQDQVGKLEGTARITAGALHLDGGGWFRSPTIAKNLTEKTLVARVQLDDLDQRGGGVLSVQTPDGQVFDAIVFGEQAPKKWIAGSNFFARTQAFVGGQPESMKGADEWIHLALVTTPIEPASPPGEPASPIAEVRLYRNGKPYGEPYRITAHEFTADNWQVLLGMRHGTSVAGNRMLSGRLSDAAVYDKALNQKQVATLAAASPLPPKEQLIALLSENDAAQFRQATSELQGLNEQKRHLADTPPEQDAALRAWSDLAHALLNTKEFLYVR